MILVTGATGNVGRELTRQLLDMGERIRLLTRSPSTVSVPTGAEVVGGDLGRPATLGPALVGVRRLFLNVPPGTGQGVLEVARAHGVRRVVVLSSGNARAAREWDAIGGMHAATERAVAASGLDWTALRPGAFASNALAWAPGIRAESVVRQAYPLAARATIHPADIAAAAVATLLGDGHGGQAYELTGGESLTFADEVAAIGAAIGRPVRLEPLSPEQARARMVQVMPEAIADTLLRLWAEIDGTTAPVRDTVQRLTGSAPRTFAEWAKEHADTFR